MQQKSISAGQVTSTCRGLRKSSLIVICHRNWEQTLFFFFQNVKRAVIEPPRWERLCCKSGSSVYSNPRVDFAANLFPLNCAPAARYPHRRHYRINSGLCQCTAVSYFYGSPRGLIMLKKIWKSFTRLVRSNGNNKKSYSYQSHNQAGNNVSFNSYQCQHYDNKRFGLPDSLLRRLSNIPPSQQSGS